MEALLSPPVSLAAPETKEKKRPPTILAALADSTPEERAADPAKNAACAKALYGVMLTWAAHHEPTYQEMEENHAFYAGQHYGFKSAALNLRVLTPEAPSKIVRLTFNYVRRAVEKCVTIILSDLPVIKCLAGDSEVLDRAASEAADDIVDWRQHKTGLAAEPERVARAATIAGVAWVHREWDQTAGPEVESGQFRVFDETGAPLPVPEPIMVRQGDFRSEILVLREVVPDPAAAHPFQGSAIFIRRMVSRFDFQHRFPDLDISEFPPEGDEKLKAVSATGQGNATGNSGPKTGTDEDKADQIEVVIGYIPKCLDYERGRRIVFTAQRIVEETDNPRYPTEEEAALGETEPNPSEEPCWPVFPFPHLLREKSPFGYSPVHDAIQPNKAINGLGSMAVMHAGKLGKAKVKVPNDLAQEWTDEQAQVFKVPRRYFDHNTLGYIAPPPMPPEYITLWRENKEALYEFMGLNAPSVGQLDTSEQSGYAIQQRQQTASDELEKVRSRHNGMWAMVYCYDLLLWRRHADTKRSIELIGGNRRSALRALDKTAILPGTSVRAVNDSAIPRDPARKMIFLRELIQAGVFPMQDKTTRQKVLSLFRLQDFDAFEESEQADRMRAERQIRRVLDGEEPGEVSDIDDHLVQMTVLREFMLSEEFEQIVAQELNENAPPPGMMPAMGAMPPTSPIYTRLMGLYQKHKEALAAQTQMGAPPPMPAEGAGPAKQAGPPAAQAA